MTQFTVDPTVLQSHASAVAGVSQRVGSAAEAAAQVQLGGDAYGVIISPIMGLVLPKLLPNMSSMIKQAAELGDSMVDGLRSNSDVYQGVEDELSQALKSVDH